MIIYRCTNIFTGQCYIGQSKKKLCEKRRDHVYEAFKRMATNKFHRALREGGLLAFDWEIIFESDDYAEISIMEGLLIKKFNCI